MKGAGSDRSGYSLRRSLKTATGVGLSAVKLIMMTILPPYFIPFVETVKESNCTCVKLSTGLIYGTLQPTDSLEKGSI